MSAIRLLVVQDHLLIRQGLRALLERQADFAVIGDAGTADEAIELARRERPSVVLFDLSLQGESAHEAIPTLVAIDSKVRVLILTSIRDVDQHRRAVRLGASGVVLKDQAGDVLAKAIRRVDAGEVWIDRSMTSEILAELRQGARPAPDPNVARIDLLTVREREIVGAVARGHSTARIADLLSISEKTVRNHLASIYDKLEISDRLELALYAVKYKIDNDGSVNPTSTEKT